MNWTISHWKYADCNGRLIEKWTVIGPGGRQFDADNEGDAKWLHGALLLGRTTTENDEHTSNAQRERPAGE